MFGVGELWIFNKDAERVVGLYRRHASRWAEKRAVQSKLVTETAWLDRFISLLPPRAAVLDVGCGSGEPIGRYLAERGCALTGLDSAPEMIALCRDRLPEQTWCVADMRSMSFDVDFNGILAWDSFFHLCHDDQRRMFPIFRAHAASHAALMFTSGTTYGEAIGTFEDEPLYHASLDGAEYRHLLAENGFVVMKHVIEDPNCGRRTVWLARRSNV